MDLLRKTTDGIIAEYPRILFPISCSLRCIHGNGSSLEWGRDPIVHFLLGFMSSQSCNREFCTN
jgi:hypothetical protein